MKLAANFISSFKKQYLPTLQKAGLNPNSLKDKHSMTSFYKQHLLPAIATELDMHALEKEYLWMDITLYRKGNHGYMVPMVLIESENDPTADLDKEIFKLLSLNAPLKVLFTRGSFKEDHANEDTYWRYPIEDFKQHNAIKGEFIILSAIWDDDQLKYEYLCYDETGTSNVPVNLIQSDSIEGILLSP